MLKHISKFTIILIFSMLYTTTTISASSLTVEDVRPIIEEAYFEEVDPDIFNGTIDDVFNALDKYSTYYNQEEYEQFLNSIDPSYVGIGVSFTLVEQGALIQNVFPQSPADEANIISGDIIIGVNGESLKGKASEEIVSLISGPESSSVTLTIKRNNQEKTVTLVREKIQAPTVVSQKLAGNIGYISFTSFPEDLLQELKSHKQQLNGVDGWIIDIRNNGGGFLNAAQRLLGMFSNIDTTMIARFKDYQEKLPVIHQDEKFQQPVNMLINRFSASASEIVAAALKDYDLATLYGETTYGKGRMQSLIEIPEQGMIKLTVATFLSPLGQTIDEKGVSPDVKTNTPLEDAHWNLLKQNLNYNVFNELEVQTDHKFNVTLNDQADLESFKEHIELFTLGGQTIDLKVEYLDQNQYQVTPKVNLQTDQEYALTVHPGWTNVQGIEAKKGIIVRVNVNE